MDDQPSSSLERFVRTRGQQLTGRANYGQRSFTIQIWVGAALATVGTVMAISPVFGAKHDLMIAAIGPYTAGIVNIIVPLVMRRKFASVQPVTVKLTPEAKRLLSALVWKHVWSKSRWYSGEGVWDTPEAWQGSSWKHYLEEPLREISGDVLAQLEAAAFQFNRIQACLVTTGSGTVLEKMLPRIVPAADEAMADVLHQAALMAKFPEGSEGVRVKMENTTHTLKELAERIEKLNLSEPTLTEKLSRRSSIVDVLDELRLEQAARNELGHRADAEEELRNFGG